ncbi:hypothetical protein FIE12Z_7262 [Fusarium flagelliforme]|uniref:Uncharacterized protein n=1 Tax=Fusarium flagelliforme TaxID=2675880 RepID=A0A395MKR6_9HYPO|nr:hypothetical protein FIE12Z_7262 [Fusarium flagelliforme]
MGFSTVFENPWSGVPMELGDAAAKHLELIEIFLKLLTHLGGEDGKISDETLAYSEWRYVVYLRMIDARGYCPSDIPPPWDVALIMYLHMLSPSRFHHYVYDTRHRVLNGIFGLQHRHFPLSELLSGEWYPRRSRKLWLDNNKPDSTACPGPNLPYQLWPSAPWNKRSSLGVASVFGRDASRPPSSDRKWLTPTDGSPSAASKNQQPRVVLMHQWFRCRTSISEQGFKVWDIKAYTAIRTQRVEERCRTESQHEQFHSTCALQPWPSLHELRSELEQQMSFWKVMVQAKNAIPGFAETLSEHVNDYKDFLGLFAGVLPSNGRYGLYQSKHDPKHPGEHVSGAQAENRPKLRFPRLVPPTLEIDLLWHTHRLFPAHYWIYSNEEADWLLEAQVTLGPEAGKTLLGYTQEQWRDRYSRELRGGTPVDKWFTEYVPCAAKFASRDVMRTDLKDSKE